MALVGTVTKNTDKTINHTLEAGNGNRIVFAFGAHENALVAGASATYGGVAMTKLTQVADGSTHAGYLFYILEADLPDNGANTCTITAAGMTSGRGMAVACFDDLAQSAMTAYDADTLASENPKTLDVAVASANDLVISCLLSLSAASSWSAHSLDTVVTWNGYFNSTKLLFSHDLDVPAGAFTCSHTFTAAAANGVHIVLTAPALAAEPPALARIVNEHRRRMRTLLTR